MNTLLDAINRICSSMNVYGVTKEYFIWLNRKMFTQIIFEIKDKVTNAGMYEINGEFVPEEVAKGDKFVYRDPQDFTYTFQIADVFMVTVQ